MQNGKLRIGVDATSWQNKRGYGRHARSLLRALAECDHDSHYTFFVDGSLSDESLPKNVDVIPISTTAPTVVAAASNGRRSLADMWRVSRTLSRQKLDVLFFPTIYSYVPVHSRAKKIVMIHDVIAEKYPALTTPTHTSRLFWRTKVFLGRWQADAIATVSEYSRQGLIEHFGLEPERVHVVGEASDPRFRVLSDAKATARLKSLGLRSADRIVVYVGGFGPHKNLESLISCFAKIASQQSFSDVTLVLVGEHEKEVFHSYAATIKKQVVELELTERVVFTGYLPDDDLISLLNLSTVCVLPSLIEGFGLPAVEAAACGCPVIATKESPLPTLLGAGGLYIDPTQPAELEEALLQVLDSTSQREKMSEAGIAAAGRLTWHAAAQQMRALFRDVARS